MYSIFGGMKSIAVSRLLRVFVPETKVWLQVCPWRVPAGFPSPAADYAHKRIDLNEHLIRNKEATFVFRVKGDSMNGHGHIVIAVLNGEFTVKRLHSRGGVVKLIPENPRYPTIVLKDGQELVVWGVVTRNLPKPF
jgi:DNA polymerase V